MDSKTKASIATGTIQETVKRAFGEGIYALKVCELTDGWYNSAYSLKLNNGINTVLKISPDPSCEVLTYEQDIMAVEVKTMEWLRSTDIPVPEVYYADFSRKVISNDYFFMQHYEGVPLNRAFQEMSAEQKERISYEYGATIAKINSITGTGYGTILNNASKSWSVTFSRMLDDILDDAARFKVKLPFSRQELVAELSEAYDVLNDVTQPSLLHWDSWEGNFFVNFNNGVPFIEGVIDWERSFYGDPLAEYVFMSDKSESFKQGYGKNLIEHRSGKVRRLLYNIYINLVMLVECAPRQYNDKSIAPRSYKNIVTDLNLLKEANQVLRRTPTSSAGEL